jgi:hypothetical protein
MARKKEAATGVKEAGIGTMVEKAVSMVGWLKTLGGTLTDRLEKGIEAQARRVMLFGLWAILMGVGLSIFILGILFLVIDLGGISRGVVFTVGGLLVFLPAWVAWLLMRK